MAEEDSVSVADSAGGSVSEVVAVAESAEVGQEKQKTQAQEQEQEQEIVAVSASSSPADAGAEGAGGSAVSVEEEKIVRVPRIDSLGRSYATGKRKSSVARVWLRRGVGKIQVNGKDLKQYLARSVLQMLVRQPLEVVGELGSFDVICTAKGGGLSGQAGAIKHGISRALVYFDPSFRPALKRAGFMTRDARIVERKKYGKPKARRSFQFSKR